MSVAIKCGICWEKIRHDNTVVTPCKHNYCTPCFFRWLKEKQNCPACRNEFGNHIVENREEFLEEINQSITTNFRILRQVRNSNRALTRTNRRLMDRNSSLRRSIGNKYCELECLQTECADTREALQASLNYRRDWEELYGFSYTSHTS
jgi:hypothetical protein